MTNTCCLCRTSHVPLLSRSGKEGQVADVKRRTPFQKDKPLLLGKLRVRLSTVAPGKTWKVALPMLAGRRNGGERTGTAHLSIRVRTMPAYERCRFLLIFGPYGTGTIAGSAEGRQKMA